MYEDFRDYFEAIGLTQSAFVDRVNRAFQNIARLQVGDVIGVLVEDGVDAEGNRTYQHLVVVTDRFITFAQSFLHAEDYHLNTFSAAGSIGHVQIHGTQYDFEAAQPESRLQLVVHSGGGLGGWSIETTGTNCDHAWRLYSEVLRPRLFGGE